MKNKLIKIILIVLLFTSSAIFGQSPINEHFSTTLPLGWSNTIIQGGTDWTFSSSPNFSSTSGSEYAVFNDFILGAGVTPNKAKLETYSFDCTGRTSVHLRFAQYWEAVEDTYGYVELSTDGGGTWAEILTDSITAGSLATPDFKDIDITAQCLNKTDVKIRFRYTDGNVFGKYWYRRALK